MTQTEPKCGKCGKVMTPENSRRRPELFTCDGCLDAIMGGKALRPLDTARNPIIMDRWYWATTRTGKLCGTGKFAKTIGSDDFTFFINGVGYSADAFTYELAATPPEIWECIMYHVIVSNQVYVSYARFTGNRCEAFATSAEDYEAVSFTRDRALIVAKACGGSLKRAIE